MVKQYKISRTKKLQTSVRSKEYSEALESMKSLTPSQFADTIAKLDKKLSRKVFDAFYHHIAQFAKFKLVEKCFSRVSPSKRVRDAFIKRKVEAKRQSIRATHYVSVSPRAQKKSRIDRKRRSIRAVLRKSPRVVRR